MRKILSEPLFNHNIDFPLKITSISSFILQVLLCTIMGWDRFLTTVNVDENSLLKGLYFDPLRSGWTRPGGGPVPILAVRRGRRSEGQVVQKPSTQTATPLSARVRFTDRIWRKRSNSQRRRPNRQTPETFCTSSPTMFHRWMRGRPVLLS